MPDARFQIPDAGRWTLDAGRPDASSQSRFINCCLTLRDSRLACRELEDNLQEKRSLAAAAILGPLNHPSANRGSKFGTKKDCTTLRYSLPYQPSKSLSQELGEGQQSCDSESVAFKRHCLSSPKRNLASPVGLAIDAEDYIFTVDLNRDGAFGSVWVWRKVAVVLSCRLFVLQTQRKRLLTVWIHLNSCPVTVGWEQGLGWHRPTVTGTLFGWAAWRVAGDASTAVEPSQSHDRMRMRSAGAGTGTGTGTGTAGSHFVPSPPK
ncbi:hypothetical protein MBM_02602 [Drepanopeziza brunnea f. sp. 'multigermtubi' MB_m1]|uniref:Uncharacterized protein n=1 Tax=Marssonina brunnea f. sp. multigermtubi (strain MB_m1) TaxID=1072389 RepID=K1WNW2_MARBU|nr:uncharacterized protein MBM_02602 [Drepanopeziza brunnea f. sp. 'multigermtubi' MB_m1]EKD19365.1 hypothetical protein MBM_02602 [Drepanopeziza brunnea f. sp. 'multigermtubi' MB_m1]